MSRGGRIVMYNEAEKGLMKAYLDKKTAECLGQLLPFVFPKEELGCLSKELDRVNGGLHRSPDGLNVCLKRMNGNNGPAPANRKTGELCAFVEEILQAAGKKVLRRYKIALKERTGSHKAMAAQIKGLRKENKKLRDENRVLLGDLKSLKKIQSAVEDYQKVK